MEVNQLADCQARKVALYNTHSLHMPLIWTGPVEQEKFFFSCYYRTRVFFYTVEELERYEKKRAKITDKGWLQSENG